MYIRPTLCMKPQYLLILNPPPPPTFLHSACGDSYAQKFIEGEIIKRCRHRPDTGIGRGSRI